MYLAALSLVQPVRLLRVCSDAVSFGNNFCQTDYLEIYFTDLRQISCLVDDQSEISFLIVQDVAMAVTFCRLFHRTNFR